MNQQPTCKFPEKVPGIAPEILISSYYEALEQVFRRRGISRAEIKASVNWKPDKSEEDQRLDYSCEISNIYVQIFNGAPYKVYAAIVRTFSMLSLINRGVIDQKFLEFDTEGNVIVPKAVLAVAATLPLEATKGFEINTFISTLSAELGNNYDLPN